MGSLYTILVGVTLVDDDDDGEEEGFLLERACGAEGATVDSIFIRFSFQFFFCNYLGFFPIL